jgi:hypothetical protein
MRCAERIVFALRAAGETGKPAGLAQGSDALAPSGQDLVRIGLVPDIPDQPVIRRIEDMVQGDGEFDDAEPGTEMPARDRNRVDRLETQFVGELAQLRITQGPQIGGLVDRVEEGRVGTWHEPGLISFEKLPLE